MNRKKIMRHLQAVAVAMVLTIVFCFVQRNQPLISGALPPGGAGMPSFEDMFKGVDWNEFSKALEEEIKAIEAEEASGKSNSASSFASPSSGTSSKTSETTMSGKLGILPGSSMKKEEPTNISDNPEELLLKPPVVTVTRNGKKTQLPHEKAVKVLSDYCTDIRNALDSISKKALTTTSEAFREYYRSTHATNVIELNVALAIILDQRAYRVIVMVPPKDIEKIMSDFRKALIQTRKDLMKLDAELIVNEATELATERDAMTKLTDLARPKPPVTVPAKKIQNTDNEHEDEENYQSTPKQVAPAAASKPDYSSLFNTGGLGGLSGLRPPNPGTLLNLEN